MGKVFLLQGAIEANLVYLSVILVLTTVASYWYYLRVAWYMWMREGPAADVEVIHVPFGMRLALIGGVILIVYWGVFPGATMELARSSVVGPSVVGSDFIGLAP